MLHRVNKALMNHQSPLCWVWCVFVVIRGKVANKRRYGLKIKEVIQNRQL